MASQIKALGQKFDDKELVPTDLFDLKYGLTNQSVGTKILVTRFLERWQSGRMRRS